MHKNEVGLDDVFNEVEEEVFHQFPGTRVTVCCVVLKNGFSVVGQSHCVDPANFNVGIGRSIAQADALEKVGQFLAFRRRDQITRDEAATAPDPVSGD